MNLLDLLTREIRVFLIATLPVIELRGAIPYAIHQGMSPIHAAILCIAGSMVPVPFLLFFLKPFFSKLRKIPIISKIEQWLIRRTERKTRNIRKYSMFGLVLFVAIPLPTTGVWTGATAAALFNLPTKYAFLSILAGNIIAAFITTFLSHLAVLKI